MRLAQYDSPIITIAHIATWVVISITFIALVYNVQFASTQGDDYLFSRLARELGASPFVVHRYQSWNGRFASDIWYGVIYSIVNVTTHPWAGALIIIVLFTAGTWYGYARFNSAPTRERAGQGCARANRATEMPLLSRECCCFFTCWLSIPLYSTAYQLGFPTRSAPLTCLGR